MKRPWIAFFSQTGYEILEVSRNLGIEPDLIVYNGNSSLMICNQLLSLYMDRFKSIPLRPKEEDYKILEEYNNPIITLNGYLRVIPENICNKYEIYNQHPGDIVTYPHLKGFNPQEKAFNESHEYVGTVIHRVTKDVDCGDIISRSTFKNNAISLNDLIVDIKREAIILWCKFLKEKLCV